MAHLAEDVILRLAVAEERLAGKLEYVSV